MRRPDASRQSTERSGAKELALRLLMPALLVVMVGISACSEQITKHGHLFRESDIAQVQPGMGQEQVKLILGSPTTTTTIGNGSAYYYISSTEKRVAFMSGSEVDRQVLAVYFTPAQTVDRVANYGLKDGKVFDFVSRTTPAPGGKEDGIFKQLFRNLGTKQIFGE
ncbi:outer membrane protein assembly factor BamE [uncultured Hyphomicrobium sp.]|uniref:outer membrane protein assembly factor BamE n=1 Tax=uncultured Hyphomicrobium sp. TaxID=194373 RepID=UPI0025F2660C|nr:outer membrane protein assembly factor BamE [uncultured Hyphomicrobium sp.]